jgi:SpoVK/Ycf46/Vps4 family AAA+-type ATPase
MMPETDAVAASVVSASVVIPVDYVGHEDIRKDLADLKSRIVKQHSDAGGTIGPKVYIFRGNTGTGKSLVADCFGKELQQEGSLSSDDVHPVMDARTLSKQFADEFALKRFLSERKPAVLIVDHATETAETIAYIHELINTVTKPEEKCVCIIIGNNEGFEIFFREYSTDIQRVRIFDFKDFSLEELALILMKKLRSHGINFDPALKKHFMYYISEHMSDSSCKYKNGWLIENDVIPRIDKNLGNDMTITAENLPLKNSTRTETEIYAELDGLIGLGGVKKKVREIEKTIRNKKKRAEVLGVKGGSSAVHFVFTGNPGTGKTTVARILGKLFKAVGLLPTDKVIETDRAGLVAEYLGQTAPKTLAKCEAAMGGILLIDEAYTLAGREPGQKDAFGQEAVDALLKKMEDDRGKFVVIAAGYKNEMDNFINSNPGLKSRFTDYIHLDDNTADELFAIYKNMTKQNGYSLSDSAEVRAKEAIDEIYRNRDKFFANGREMRTLFEKTERRQASRVDSLPEEEQTAKAYLVITEDDIPWEPPREQTPEEILAELESMTGLDSVKIVVRELLSTISAQAERRKLGLKDQGQAVHFVFTGNPGTGKTTVARMLGKLFKAIGLLSTDKVVEVSRAEMVAQHVGGTAPKVQAVCDKASGGILFIDEAYTLNRGDGDTFGREAVETLLKRMEDDRGKFIVIAAGYPKNMDDFLSTNPGLPSRFTMTLNLADYTPDELYEIFTKNAAAAEYELTDDAAALVKTAIEDMYRSRGRNWANARTIREFLNTVIRRQSTRIAALGEDKPKGRETFITILPEDIPFEIKKEPSVEEIINTLNDMTGLAEVKTAIKEICADISIRQKREQQGQDCGKPSPVHFVFTGNPGTGKTTVARKLGALFKAMGLLPTDRVLETTRADFVAQYAGQTAPLVNKTCDRAEGGILFIDEAYLFCQNPNDSFGLEAVAALLKRMEDDRGKYVVIAAGYEKEMNDFLAVNSGFKSRFTKTLYLADYTPDELYEIYTKMAASENFVLDDGAKEAVQKAAADFFANRGRDFANGRTIRQFLEASVRRMGMRVGKLPPEQQTGAALSLITAEDIEGGTA